MLLVILGLDTHLDLFLAACFYDPSAPQGWFWGEAILWRWLYHYGTYPTLVLTVGAVLVCLGSLVRHSWVDYRRACLLLVLAVVLGPGLLVNGVLKPYWGRPRPRQVELFGGSLPYRQWWQPGGTRVGRSFPSGHAAMGYVLIAGAFLVPQRRHPWWRVLVWVGALTYGTLLGFARIVQGGHFASDVLWAGGLMCLTVFGLRVALYAWPPPAQPMQPRGG
jgi:membrane-associated PAP2 superfamily phosphatase